MINRFPLKTTTLKYFYTLVIITILVACSTNKDTFLARNSHALSTKFNIDYNGEVALDKGIESLKSSNKDNFWKTLPIEDLQIIEGSEEKAKNANFELAEAKATKAIQKHSMNIDGRERNSQMDEAYLLLGKSRYYDQRFIPALDAFNYILYKYPTSDKFYQAKVWREKTNMRLGNDVQVIKNITDLLESKDLKIAKTSKEKNIGKSANNKSKITKNKKLKKQVVADAYALLATSYLNLEEKDSAISKLKIAEKYTRINSEKARYRFILGQLYQELGKKDSAKISYQSVIKMKRKAARIFTIQSYAKIAELFDYEKGDKAGFLKTFDDLAADRENRPFLDIINYEKGVFYDKTNDQKLALKHYNIALKKASSDQYLIASSYRNIGNMYFKNTDYSKAAKYYDSTLVKLSPKTREFIHITKVRKDLDEVIRYEKIAKVNDSILNVVSMSAQNKISYYEKHIEKIKKEDEKKKLLEDKEKQKLENIDRNNINSSDDPGTIVRKPGVPPKAPSFPNPSANTAAGNTGNTFYFYNPSTIAFGKNEFKKKWGKRSLGSNWRLSSVGTNSSEVADLNTNDATVVDEKTAETEIPEKYTTEFYISQLPTKEKEIEEIAKERNYAYYQLGLIYKEKLKEYALATNKLEQLLTQNPEQNLVLPSMYNLYKIYQITDAAKAEEMKKRISSQYPDSRYAQIINNTNPKAETNETPEAVYDKWFKLYEEEQFGSILEKIDVVITDYIGEEIAPKFELLKANSIGKIRGLAAYKKAMQVVLENYPNSEEGKNAGEILTNQIPALEKKNFTAKDTKNWKILYKVDKKEDKNTQSIEEKIKKLIENDNVNKLSFSKDIYTEKEDFVVIQGLKSESEANDISYLLKDDKKYKIAEPAVVITNENYNLVQIKKNVSEYKIPAKATNLPNPTEVPQTAIPVIEKTNKKRPMALPPAGNSPMDVNDTDPVQPKTTPRK